jgi:hypothetical protein
MSLLPLPARRGTTAPVVSASALAVLPAAAERQWRASVTIPVGCPVVCLVVCPVVFHVVHGPDGVVIQWRSPPDDQIPGTVHSQPGGSDAGCLDIPPRVTFIPQGTVPLCGIGQRR